MGGCFCFVFVCMFAFLWEGGGRVETDPRRGISRSIKTSWKAILFLLGSYL